MDNWPSQHRTALALFMIVIMAAVIAYIFAVRPQVLEVKGRQAERDGLLKDLKEKGKGGSQYPLDATRLEALVAAEKAKLDGVTRKRDDGTTYNTGLVARAEEVLVRATSMFDERIKSEYTDVATFLKQVSRIIYRDELDQLNQRLKSKNILLVDEVLGIGEDTVDVETYELLLKVWTIDRLVKVIVDDNGLFVQRKRLARRPGEEPPDNALGRMMSRARFASEITVLPTRSYVLSEDDREPYILEFPIRIRFQGPLPTVCEAIQDLQKDKNFMTVNRFVLESEAPDLLTSRKPGSDGMVRSRNVVVMIEISSYFRPSGHAPTIRNTKGKQLPRGA